MITCKNHFITGAIVALVAALTFAQTAQAEWYISGNAGYSIPEDTDFSDEFILLGAAVTSSGETEFDDGYFFSGAVGHSWESLRLEGEVSYREHDLEELTLESISAGTSILSINFSNLNIPLDISGDVSNLSFMANAWYDFDTGTAWTPFIGGGRGVSILDLDIESFVGVDADYNDDDTVFAYQLGAGVGYELIDNVSVNLSYRYFDTGEVELEDSGEEVESSTTSHDLMAGLIVKF